MCIIGIISFLALWGVVFAMQNGMNDFAGDRSIPVVLRVLVIELCGQFGISGSLCFPSKYRFFDWGALVCAIMCILVHGAVGVTPEAVLEMAATFILIYGMLIVRKETGNAWGCILIFFVYWNAI